MPMRVDDENGDVLLLSLMGLVSQNSKEDVVVQGSGLSRGDKRRNARLARLRELVQADNAILGIDLAVGGHEKLPTGGHENARSRPISSAHWRTRKCPLAAMNLPRP